MKYVWHQQVKWRQQGILFVVLFLLAASINVPLALQFRRTHDAPLLPNEITLRDEEATAMGWPSEIPKDMEWPQPTHWERSSVLGYTIIAARSTDFLMGYEQVGLPMSVFERTNYWWEPIGSETRIDTVIIQEFYDLRWVGLLCNPLLIATPVWLFLFLLFPGRVLIIEAKRHSRGKCIKCGYDLRGTSGGGGGGESGCPECGWGRA